MTRLALCEQQNIAKLRAYRELVSMEVREGHIDQARYWRRIAHSYVNNIRLLRSAA
jgi:uncharacterized protein YaaW (UPF0174 family)